YFDNIAFGIICPDRFFNLIFVFGNDAVCCVDDDFCRTIVLFQFKQPVIGVVFFEVENVVDICSSKGINTLGVIAHNTNIFVQRSELLYNKVLRVVGILVLIHQYMMEFVLVFMQDFRKIAQQHIGVV